MNRIFHVQSEVVESRPLGDSHHRLLLRATQIASTARPGQFVHCAPASPSKTPALLRRPLSIFGVSANEAGKDEFIELAFRLIGPGTRFLSNRRPGEIVDCLGPLGNGFRLAPDRVSLLIGGGTGVIPLRWLALKLLESGSEVHFWAGAQTAQDLPIAVAAEEDKFILPELECPGAFTEFVSEENGLMVTDLVKKKLPEFRAKGTSLQAYAVGPRPMLAALAKVLPEDLPCQVSLEERMACGVGACRSCVVAIKSSEPAGYNYKRVCKEGPVFDLREIVFEQEAQLG